MSSYMIFHDFCVIQITEAVAILIGIYFILI